MTDREAEIELGTTYPFGALQPGECIITTELAFLFNVT